MTNLTAPNGKPRVIIDFKPNGDFVVHSDPEAEVIVRCAHAPEDELVRYGHYPIPEEWLRDKPVGFLGDGSAADKRAQLFAKAIKGIRRA
jgi:hypothetical protein